eukprot:scaffold296400_cov79-Cyclotella_meneghiniana.AAC.4
MVEAGVIPVLVQFVCPKISKSPKALVCLRQITRASHAHLNKALDTDLFRCLCAYLVTSYSQKNKSLSLSLMYSMMYSVTSEKRKDLLHKICTHSGAIRSLVNLMTKQGDNEISSYIMTEILIVQNTEEVIQEAVAAGIIKNSIRCTSEAGATDCALQMLCMILGKLNQEHVDDAVRFGAIDVLAKLIAQSNGFSNRARRSLQALSYISQFAVNYRNKVLNSHVLTYVTTWLRIESLQPAEAQCCLFFVYSLSICGNNKILVDEIIHSGMVPSLFKMAGFASSHQVYALGILSGILVEQDTGSTIHEMARANIISILVDF